MSSLSALTTLSPIDGRYVTKIDPLRKWLSEATFIRGHMEVEAHRLIALSQAGLAEVPHFSTATEDAPLALVENFVEADVARIEEVEAATNHDVRAVEYQTKECVHGNAELEAVSEFIHFACMSEDINNTSHGVMPKGACNTVIVPTLRRVQARLVKLTYANADAPMLSRTHGQPASPATLGKEMANVATRLNRAIRHIEAAELLGKMNGAVGSYNAHLSAHPSLGREAFSRNVIETRPSPTLNPYTIQTEPHDYMAELFDVVARVSTIIPDLDHDVRDYVSQGYFKQKAKVGEISSPTMPHKINPIDFENSEGNVGLADAVLHHLLEKLPVSRRQRDLTDSTILRNIGVAFGYGLLAYDACLHGLDKPGTNPACLTGDLDACWEILAEPVQTVIRRYGITSPYGQLKEPTCGKGISRGALREFIGTLAIPEDARKLLLDMMPASYIGKAEKLTRRIT